MNTMMYKGYAARLEYNEEDACFVGHIAGIRAIVGFHGESVAELRQAFHEAVDHYLATCRELGERPEKPYSGKLMLRVLPEVHAAASVRAQVEGKSLNQWAAEVLAQATRT